MTNLLKVSILAKMLLSPKILAWVIAHWLVIIVATKLQVAT
jgi:hypothetical protein